MRESNLQVFQKFIFQIEEHNDLMEKLMSIQSQYGLKKYKLTEISINIALELYHNIVEKFYKNHQVGNYPTWVENQLRLYLWSLSCYLIAKDKNIFGMREEDWLFFSKMFYCKEYSLFEYQGKIFFELQYKNTKWLEQEDEIFNQLMVENKEAKWNQVAKSLYIISNKKFLRSAKQCRQRWLNHLDPNKVKQTWELREFLVLFECVKERGKKWALIVKKLENRRTQHSIKNKYNSIFRKQNRLTPTLSQQQIYDMVISRIRKIMVNNTIDDHDEIIFGSTAKLLMGMNVKSRNRKAKQKKYSEIEEIYKPNERFQNFRKKIIGMNFNNIQRNKGDNFPKYQSNKNYSIKRPNAKGIQIVLEMDRDREEIKDYSNINLNIFEDNEEIESLSYQIVNNSFRDLLESSEI